MADHNPYVGIQHTVFGQGWKRACTLMLKSLEDMQKVSGDHDYAEVLTFASIKGIVQDVRDA